MQTKSSLSCLDWASAEDESGRKIRRNFNKQIPISIWCTPDEFRVKAHRNDTTNNLVGLTWTASGNNSNAIFKNAGKAGFVWLEQKKRIARQNYFHCAGQHSFRIGDLVRYQRKFPQPPTGNNSHPTMCALWIWAIWWAKNPSGGQNYQTKNQICAFVIAAKRNMKWQRIHDD